MSHSHIPTELGTEKISKLLKKYAVPAIIAMTATSLYNMVDTIFIGHGVGAYAISGLAVTFPLMNISAAFGTLVGIGAGTLVSIRLGQKDYATAQKVFGNLVVLNVIIGLLFTIVSLLFLDPILYFFGASEQTIPYARDYMIIILFGNIFTHLYFGLNNILRSSGYPRKAMMLTITTVVLNTIFDPIFIFVFKWGVQGAAFVTIMSQLVALVWQMNIYRNKNELIHFRKGIYKIDFRLAKDMFTIGLSPFLMNVASCFIVILINNGMKTYSGDLAIGAYGIVNRFSIMFFMIVMGFNQGMQPIAGYNYGARHTSRVLDVLWLTVFFATIVTAISFLIGEFFPEAVARAFTNDEELINLAVYGLRITVMFFPLIGAQIVIVSFFQSTGMPGKAILLSLIRQVIVFIPCLIVLPKFFGLTGVWVSGPVSDFVACAVSIAMVLNRIRKFKTEEI